MAVEDGAIEVGRAVPVGRESRRLTPSMPSRLPSTLSPSPPSRPPRRPPLAEGVAMEEAEEDDAEVAGVGGGRSRRNITASDLSFSSGFYTYVRQSQGEIRKQGERVPPLINIWKAPSATPGVLKIMS